MLHYTEGHRTAETRRILVTVFIPRLLPPYEHLRRQNMSSLTPIHKHKLLLIAISSRHRKNELHLHKLIIVMSLNYYCYKSCCFHHRRAAF